MGERVYRDFLNNRLRPDLGLYLDGIEERGYELNDQQRKFAYKLLKFIRPTVDYNPWRDMGTVRIEFTNELENSSDDLIVVSRYLRNELDSANFIEWDNHKFRFRQDPESMYNVYQFLIELGNSADVDGKELNNLVEMALHIKDDYPGYVQGPE